jgi:hypothetical protein
LTSTWAYIPTTLQDATFELEDKGLSLRDTNDVFSFESMIVKEI